MTLQTSDAVANARLDMLEMTVGADAILMIRTGKVPVRCSAPDKGTVLATLSLPVQYMQPATERTKAMSDVWEKVAGEVKGTAGHFRLYESDGVTCHLQGSVTATDGGGDLELDTTTFEPGQSVMITMFTLIEDD